MTKHPGSPGRRLPLWLLAGFGVLLVSALLVHRPDRPVATIVPGSSPGPTFVVQVIRPRLGLPLGGLIPPGWVGLDSELVFDSSAPGAVTGAVGPRRVELRGDTWELALLLDADGRVSPETELLFSMTFEDRDRRVRCRPGPRAVGEVRVVELAGSTELAGSFDVQLAECEDATTGEPLGWPPEPLLLHGSFDRLPVDGGPGGD